MHVPVHIVSYPPSMCVGGSCSPEPGSQWHGSFRLLSNVQLIPFDFLDKPLHLEQAVRDIVGNGPTTFPPLASAQLLCPINGPESAIGFFFSCHPAAQAPRGFQRAPGTPPCLPLTCMMRFPQFRRPCAAAVQVPLETRSR